MGKAVGVSRFCVSHGGYLGLRCHTPGCIKPPKAGKDFCKEHVAPTARCVQDGCHKLSRTPSGAVLSPENTTTTPFFARKPDALSTITCAVIWCLEHSNRSRFWLVAPAHKHASRVDVRAPAGVAWARETRGETKNDDGMPVRFTCFVFGCQRFYLLEAGKGAPFARAACTTMRVTLVY